MATKISDLIFTIGANASPAIAALGKFNDAISQIQKQGRAAEISSVGGFAGKFAGVAQGLADIATAARTGEDSGKALLAVFDKIPIAGEFRKAGESIREFITGEKAALALAEKLGDAAGKFAEKLKKIADEQSVFGLRGPSREMREADIGKGDEIRKLSKDKTDLIAQRDEILNRWVHLGSTFEERGHVGQGRENLNSAEKAIVAQLDKEIAAKEKGGAESLAVDARNAQKKKDIQIAAAHELELYLYERGQRVEQLNAHNEEVALKRSGKMLESAIHHVQFNTKDEIEKLQHEAVEKARDYELSAEAMNKNGDTKGAAEQSESAAKIYKATNDQIAALKTQGAQTVDDVTTEMNRKEREDTRAAQSELAKLQAEAHAERLKASGEHAEAERVQAWDGYRKEIEDLEKSYREKNRVTEANLNDPTLKAAEDAALNKLSAQLDEVEKKKRQEQADKFKGIFGIDKDGIDKLLREQYGGLHFSGGYVNAVDSHSITGAGASVGEGAERTQKTLDEILEAIEKGFKDVADSVAAADEYTGGSGTDWQGY